MPVARTPQSRVSALFLTAPEDGVAPSILLTVLDNKKKPLAQYLYNVSDGSSRLMLEHKARPGLQLKALFLSGCGPAQAGGLGSVVLRLKQDGHAVLQLVGPQGSYHCLQGLKSFIPWTHPCIRITEAQPAIITLPAHGKGPIRLQARQAKASFERKLQREVTHKAKLHRYQQRQARLAAAVKRWSDRHARTGGAESPFVMVSYQDEYTKTVGFGVNLPCDADDSSSNSGSSSSDESDDNGDCSARPGHSAQQAAAAAAAAGRGGHGSHTHQAAAAPAASAAAASAVGAGTVSRKADRATVWQIPQWLLPVEPRTRWDETDAPKSEPGSSRGSDGGSSGDTSESEAEFDWEDMTTSRSCDSSSSSSSSESDDDQPQQHRQGQPCSQGKRAVLGEHSRPSTSSSAGNQGGNRFSGGAAVSRKPHRKEPNRQATVAAAAAEGAAAGCAVAVGRAGALWPVSATALAARAFLGAAAAAAAGTSVHNKRKRQDDTSDSSSSSSSSDGTSSSGSSGSDTSTPSPAAATSAAAAAAAAGGPGAQVESLAALHQRHRPRKQPRISSTDSSSSSSSSSGGTSSFSDDEAGDGDEGVDTAVPGVPEGPTNISTYSFTSCDDVVDDASYYPEGQEVESQPGGAQPGKHISAQQQELFSILDTLLSARAAGSAGQQQQQRQRQRQSWIDGVGGTARQQAVALMVRARRYRQQAADSDAAAAAGGGGGDGGTAASAALASAAAGAPSDPGSGSSSDNANDNSSGSSSDGSKSPEAGTGCGANSGTDSGLDASEGLESLSVEDGAQDGQGAAAASKLPAAAAGVAAAARVAAGAANSNKKKTQQPPSGAQPGIATAELLAAERQWQLKQQEKLQRQQVLWADLRRSHRVKRAEQLDPRHQQQQQQGAGSIMQGTAAGNAVAAGQQRMQKHRQVAEGAAAAAGSAPAASGKPHRYSRAAKAITDAARAARRHPEAFYPSLLDRVGANSNSNTRGSVPQGSQSQYQGTKPQPQQIPQQVMLGYISHVGSIQATSNARRKPGWHLRDPRLPDGHAGQGHIYAVLFCSSRRQLRQLQEHPLMTLLMEKRKMVAAIIHVTSPKVASSRAFQQWLQKLPGHQATTQHRPTASVGPDMHTPQVPSAAVASTAAAAAAAAAANQQCVAKQKQQGEAQGSGAAMNNDMTQADTAAAIQQQQQQQQSDAADTAADSPAAAAGLTKLTGPEKAALVAAAAAAAADAQRTAADNLGFRASARVLARLNLVSRAMFPLPHALLPQKGLDPAGIDAVTKECHQQQQQQQQQGSQQQQQSNVHSGEGSDMEADEPSAQQHLLPVPAAPQPAAAAAAEGAAAAQQQHQPPPAAVSNQAPKPPKAVHTHFLQQLTWSGLQYMALKPALVPPFTHKDLMGLQHPMPPLDVLTLQRDLLLQRPKLQAMLGVLLKKWPGLTHAPVEPRLLLPPPRQQQQQHRWSGGQQIRHSQPVVNGMPAAAAAGAHEPFFLPQGVVVNGAPPRHGAPVLCSPAAAASNKCAARGLKDRLVQQRKQHLAEQVAAESGTAAAKAAVSPAEVEAAILPDQSGVGQEPEQQQQRRPHELLPGAYELVLESPAKPGQQQQQQGLMEPKLRQDVLHVECDVAAEHSGADAAAAAVQEQQLSEAEEALAVRYGVTCDQSDPADHPPVQFSSSWAPGTHVVFLGTGSAEPSKYRGPSAILLRIVTAGSRQCCCGEGGGFPSSSSSRDVVTGVHGQQQNGAQGTAGPAAAAAAVAPPRPPGGGPPLRRQPQHAAAAATKVAVPPPTAPVGPGPEQQVPAANPPPRPPPAGTRPSPAPGPTPGKTIGHDQVGTAAATVTAGAAATAGMRGGDGVAYMLLDAGEGTLGAIKRLYGEDDAREVILNLGCIWISHKHADHMLGVPALLEARAKLLRQLRRRAVCVFERQALRDLSGLPDLLDGVEGGDSSSVAGSDNGSSSDSSTDKCTVGDNTSSSSWAQCSSCLAEVPPLLLVGPTELHHWLKQQPGSSRWHYTIVGVEAFGGTAPAVTQQQHFWQHQQQQQLGGVHLGGVAGSGAAAGVLGGACHQQQQQQMAPQMFIRHQQALLLQQQQQQQMLLMQQQHQQQMAMLAMQQQQQQQHMMMMAGSMGCMQQPVSMFPVPGMMTCFPSASVGPVRMGTAPACMPFGTVPMGAVPMCGPMGAPMGGCWPAAGLMQGQTVQGFAPGMSDTMMTMMPGQQGFAVSGSAMMLLQQQQQQGSISNGMMHDGRLPGGQGPRPPPGGPPPAAAAAAAAGPRSLPGRPAAQPIGPVPPPRPPPSPPPASNSQLPAAAAAAGQSVPCAVAANSSTAAAAGTAPAAHSSSSRGGSDGGAPWCMRMSPADLLSWQQWQQACFAGSPAQAVMSGVMGFTGWRSVAVQHCHGAQGLVLEHSQGWKLVYSGDTRPCPALIQAGAGATLLIHEATFEASMVTHALAKNHSTVQEALQVNDKMGAYRTVLTHFSQRYPRMPAGFPADATPWRKRPLLAVDGAVLRFDLLPVLPALMPAVAAALEDIQEEEEGEEAEPSAAAAAAAAEVRVGGCRG